MDGTGSDDARGWLKTYKQKQAEKQKAEAEYGKLKQQQLKSTARKPGRKVYGPAESHYW